MFSWLNLFNRLLDKLVGHRTFLLTPTKCDYIDTRLAGDGKIYHIRCREFVYEFESDKWYIPTVRYYWYQVETVSTLGKVTRGLYPKVSLLRLPRFSYAHRQVVRTHLTLHRYIH